MPRKRQFEEDEVLLKAMHLFWEKGFYATSMENLVSSLGINRASMYNLFGSKVKLYNLTLQQYVSIKMAHIEHVFENQQNIRKGFNQLFENLLFEKEENIKGCFIVNTITELGNSDEAINTILRDYQHKARASYIDYMNSGVSEGQISPYKDLKIISKYLYSLEQGMQVALKQEIQREELMKSINIALSVLG